jgi:mannose-6-phosphate isomerase
MRDIFTHPIPLPPNRVYRQYQGGLLLEQFREEKKPQDSWYPEDWVGSTTAADENINKPEKGIPGLSRMQMETKERYLRDVIAQFPEQTIGENLYKQLGASTAMLVKLLDSNIRLPIQAHPSREYVQKYLKKTFGKTEAYIILNTRRINGEEPYILLGFKQKTNPHNFQRLIEKQDIPAQIDLLHRITVQPGDVFFVPAGTLHAIGAGVFMIEVQESSDLFILTEFNCGGIDIPPGICRMGLPWEKALMALDYTVYSEKEMLKRFKVKPTAKVQKNVTKETLIGKKQTEYFSVERYTMTGNVQLDFKKRCAVAIITDGKGTLKTATSSLACHKGDAFFFPVAMKNLTIESKSLTMIVCQPPL